MKTKTRLIDVFDINRDDWTIDGKTLIGEHVKKVIFKNDQICMFLSNGAIFPIGQLKSPKEFRLMFDLKAATEKLKGLIIENMVRAVGENTFQPMIVVQFHDTDYTLELLTENIMK